MSPNHEELLLRLAGVCCPGLPLSPAPDEAPLLLQARARRKRVYCLFTRALPLWTVKYTEYAFAFHVDELNFDTLAQCHTFALEAGTVQHNRSAKRSRFFVTALILCDTAQYEAFDSVLRFKGYPPVQNTKLTYRLAVVNHSTNEVACNRQARKLKGKLHRLLSGH